MNLGRLTEKLPNWKSVGLAIVSAILLVLAFPDFEFWWLGWVALVPLLWAIERERESTARGFVLGWLFGTIFFFGTCWWLTFAPITYASFPPALAYFLMLIVSIAAGIFPAIFGGVMAFLLRRIGSVALLVAPFVWVFTEFARYWLTGNNWNAIGYVLAFQPGGRLNLASYGGVLLCSFYVVFSSSSSLYLLLRIIQGSTIRSLIPYFVYAGLFAVLFIAGSDERTRPEKSTPEATVIALQPNVPMSGLTEAKWHELRQRHIRLAESALFSGIEGYGRMPFETNEDRKEEYDSVMDAFDEFANKFSIESLRKKNTSPQSNEVRIWVGFAPDTTRGLILTNDSAKLLPAVGESKNLTAAGAKDLKPTEGWEKFWDDKTVAGLLTFPDEPPTERIAPQYDSTAVVVEVKEGEQYRRIFYHHPCGSRGENAREFTRTLSAIGDKLGVEFYKCDDESRSKVTEPRPVTVIFPESPMNFMYETDAESKAFIDSFAAKHNVNVLFNSAEPDAATGKFFNSAVMVGPEGREIQQYDKIYLVPFGEAVPFPLEGILPGFVGNFAYGAEHSLFPLGDAKAGAMICFESHFGQLSRQYVLNGADVLIEMTNDGYLGPTPVLRQHLANAVFRAVETNRPLLRVTNVGITAYITERGEVKDAAPVYQEDTRIWTVSKSDGSQTFYVKYGDWFAWLCSIISIGLLIFGFFIKSRPSHDSDR